MRPGPAGTAVTVLFLGRPFIKYWFAGVVVTWKTLVEVNVRREEELWGVSERNHVRVSVCLLCPFRPVSPFSLSLRVVGVVVGRERGKGKERGGLISGVRAAIH